MMIFFNIIEMLLIIGAVIQISRMAEANGESGLKWGSITLAAGFASLFIPLPFLRVGLALGAVFLLMTLTKKAYA